MTAIRSHMPDTALWMTESVEKASASSDSTGADARDGPYTTSPIPSVLAPVLVATISPRVKHELRE